MRITLFRIDKIGDMIVSSPIVAAIKAKHPDANIMMVASPYNAVSVNGLSGIDELVLFNPADAQSEYPRVLKRIRAFKPTHTVVMSPKHHCYWLSLQSGATHNGWIVMEYRPLERLLARLVLPWKNIKEIFRTKPSLHHTDHILNLARRMNLAGTENVPYAVPECSAAHDAVKQRLAARGITTPFIAVHLVDKWVEENWRVEDVKHFLLQLRDVFGVEVVASAGPADKILSPALALHIPIFNDLSFAEWTVLFQQSQMVIAPDCGAVHLACAVQKPLLALYQPSRMEKAMAEYAPRMTPFRAHALIEPQNIIPTLINDIRELLGKHNE